MGPLPAPLKLQVITELSRYLGLQVGSVPDADYTWQVARTQLTARLALASRKTLTVDQRSSLAMTIIIPKLIYIGRHQWPTRTTISAFQKMITSFVWYGRFTSEDMRGRAWLNSEVAALPRAQGGLAIPDLKVELLALAAVTVNHWAVDASPNLQVVADVLAGSASSCDAPMVYVTPRHTIPSAQGKRLRDTLWDTGVLVCNAFGGVAPTPAKAEMVAALSCILYFRGPLVTKWRGRRLGVNTHGLQGSVCRMYTSVESAAYGHFCSEWVPYMVLAELRLFSTTGEVVAPRRKFRALCRQGTLLKDILHRKWINTGELLFTVLTPRVTSTVRRQVEAMTCLLLLNYPQLLRPGDHTGKVRYVSTTDGHVPLSLQVGSDRRLSQRGLLGAGTPAAPVLNNHEDLVGAVHQAVGSEATVASVHPHPRISRMVCLWAGGRRWKQPRKAYKKMFTKARDARGLAQCRLRHAKWERVKATSV